MRIVLTWVIISSILNTRLADSDQLDSNAEEVILSVRKVYKIFYNSFNRERKNITKLKVTTLVLMMSSLKGERDLCLLKKLKYIFFARLLQSQPDTKFNVFNFTIDGYMEYLAKINAYPKKEKFGENRRYVDKHSRTNKTKYL